jgi:N4-gp56 family major capsid protein
MADITTTSGAAFIPQIWANTALEILRNKVVLAKLVTRDSDVAAFQVGDTLNVPYPGSMVANDKAANTGVTLQVPTSTTTSLTLNKHKEASFILEDRFAATANQDVIARYVDAAVIAIAEQIETDIWGVASTFTNNVGTYGADLNYAALLQASKKLTDNKAPLEGRALVISTKDELAIRSDSTLQNYFAFAKPETVMNGAIGHLGGFDVYSSQLVPTAGTSPVQTKNVAFAPGAILLAMRNLPEVPAGTGALSAVANDPVSGLAVRVTRAFNAANLATQITVDVLYGVAKLREEKGVLVKS